MDVFKELSNCMDKIDNLSNYIEELEQWWKQARKRVIELVDKLNKIKDLFNKREMTWKDEFLDELRELLQD